jgi:hypothetical protein
MIKTFVINHSGLKIPAETGLFTKSLESGRNFYLFDKNTERFPEIIASIRDELALANYPAWQLIFLFTDPAQPDPTMVKSPIIKAYRQAEAFYNQMPADIPKADYNTFVYLKKDIYEPGMTADLNGCFFGTNDKLKELETELNRIWEPVGHFDGKEGIIFNGKGFEGIQGKNAKEFKGLVDERLGKIQDCFIQKLSRTDNNTADEQKPENTCYSNAELSEIKKELAVKTEELKNSTHLYHKYKPGESIRNILKSNASIYSKQFAANNTFLFDYAKAGNNPKEQFRFWLNLGLFLIFITENNLSREIKLREISIDADHETMLDSLSDYIFSLEKARTGIKSKLLDKRAEYNNFDDTEDPPWNLEEFKPDFPSHPDFGYFFRYSHITEWNQYLEKLKLALHSIKIRTDQNIASLYPVVSNYAGKPASRETMDIFAEEKTAFNHVRDSNEKIAKGFPSQNRDVMEGWDEFMADMGDTVKFQLKRMPLQKTMWAVTGAGFTALALPLLFFTGKPLLITGFIAYIALSAVLYFISMHKILKPIRQVIKKIEKDTQGRYLQLLAYKHEYIDYLKNIYKAKVARLNYQNIHKAMLEKNSEFLKWKYHEAEISVHLNKAERILKLLDKKRNPEPENTVFPVPDIEKPSFMDGFYHITAHPYSKTGEAWRLKEKNLIPLSMAG